MEADGYVIWVTRKQVVAAPNDQKWKNKKQIEEIKAYQQRQRTRR